MAKSSFPYTSQATTDLEYSRLFRELQDNGVVGSFGDGSLRLSADSSGMVTKVQPGSAIIQGFFFRSTEVESLTHAQSGQNPRIDRVVLRLDLSAAVGERITFKVLEGVQSATNQAVPALTMTETGVFEISLGRVLVGAGVTAIAPSAVTEDRPYIGGRVGVWANRPTNPVVGRTGVNLGTQTMEWWSGTEWKNVTPSMNWASIVGLPATFAPIIGTTATTAAAGNHTHPSYEASLATLTTAANSQGTQLTSHAGSIAALNSSVNSLNSGKANVNHGHDVTQISWASEPLHNFINRVLATKAELTNLRNDATGGIANAQNTANAAVGGLGGKADGWEGDNSAIRYSHGPHVSTYNRQAGNNRFAVWMDETLVWGRATSSRRYKEDIQDHEIDIEKILSLRPVNYHRISNEQDDSREFGLIAEEVHEALPEIVTWFAERDSDGNPVEDPQIDGVHYEMVGVALIPVLKALWEQNKTLVSRIEALEADR